VTASGATDHEVAAAAALSADIEFARSTCATARGRAWVAPRRARRRRQLRRRDPPRRRARPGRFAETSTSTSTARCGSAPPRGRAEGARGCIVNTASMLSFFGGGLVPGYSASKGGVAQLTKSLAIAYAADGIRVNAVAPGWIATPLTQAAAGRSGRTRTILARTPMGRWGTPDDVAGPVLFLASPAARFVTGVVLPVDGGYLHRLRSRR
jgi:hypothetical protein